MTKNLGLRIKERRKELGLTQTELARRMGYTVKNAKSSISKVECGEDNLTTVSIKKFAEALETTSSYLLGLEEEYSEALDTKILNANQQAKEDIELLEKFHKLNDTEKQIIMNTIMALLSK